MNTVQILLAAPLARPRRRRSLSMLAAVTLASTLALGTATSAQAHNPSVDLSAASALSVAVPVAVSLAGPVLVLSGATALTVAAVQASAEGTVWVLERASDGARVSVRWARDGVALSVVAVGTSVVVTAVAAGWLLSAAGEVIAFIPNEIGASLTHNERIKR